MYKETDTKFLYYKLNNTYFKNLLHLVKYLKLLILEELFLLLKIKHFIMMYSLIIAKQEDNINILIK